MSQAYTSIADYMVQTTKWRDFFHIPNHLQYAEQVQMTDEKISTLDRTAYAGFFSDAEAWGIRESARIDAAPKSEPVPEYDGIKGQLRNIPSGKYLMLHGHFGGSINPTIEQGTLTSIDWNKGTVLLHSTTYGRDTTVEIGKIAYIDESRTGSGALGAVQEADLRLVGNDWYRGNQKL